MQRAFSGLSLRAGGGGFSPATKRVAPGYFYRKNRRKIEPKEIPSHLIPRLLVVFTRQLEILVTTLAFFLHPLSGKLVIEDVNLSFILLGRIKDISSRRILDDATRKRRQKRHLEALEKDNFQEDPHSHLTVVPAKMKVPAFNDTMEGNNLL